MTKAISFTLAVLAFASASAFAATAKENLFKLEGAMSAKKVHAIVRDRILADKKVIAAVDGVDIDDLSLTRKVISPVFTDYRISFRTVEPGLGPNGPSTHPCTTIILARSVSGVTLSVPKVEVKQICAMNSPRFK